MFYKVIRNNKVIDVLDRIVYLNYQEKHKRMQFCDIEKAQAILSSDGNHIWHEETLYNIPVDGYDTVRIEEIDEYEYNQFKALNGMSKEAVIDEFLFKFVSGDTNEFVESLKRLNNSNLINSDLVESLLKSKVITESQKNYILND